MAFYLLQYSYTSEAWEKMGKTAGDGPEIGLVRQVAKKLRGHLVDAWLAFGEYDVVAILDMPNNVSAAALSVAISAGHYAKAIKTTPLMTERDGKEILRKAKGAGVRPIR